MSHLFDTTPHTRRSDRSHWQLLGAIEMRHSTLGIISLAIPMDTVSMMMGLKRQLSTSG